MSDFGCRISGDLPSAASSNRKTTGHPEIRHPKSDILHSGARANCDIVLSQMNRRIFTQALATSAAAAQEKRIGVALLTHAAGPHLAAYLEGLAKTDEVSAVY